jgi:hypothetical protein
MNNGLESYLHGHQKILLIMILFCSVLIIKLNEKPWSLGRNQQADLTIDKPTVSNWHCKLYAVSKIPLSLYRKQVIKPVDHIKLFFKKKKNRLSAILEKE